MLSKRLIVCLDVREGKVTKGVQFKGNVEVGEPVAMAEEYYHQGVDELVFYDITASPQGRTVDRSWISRVAAVLDIPKVLVSTIRSMKDLSECVWVSSNSTAR